MSNTNKFKRLDGITTPTKANTAWTTIRVRKYYRSYLRDLAKLYPIVIGGWADERPMTDMLEFLIEQAGANLIHQDMGASFEHTPDPYCGCGPIWPKSTHKVEVKTIEN